MYLLDTNICIYLIKRSPESVVQRLQQLDPDQVGISSITHSELEYGVAKSVHAEKNRRALQKFLLPLQILSYDALAAQAYGEIRVALEVAGTPIGSLDMLIAAHAKALCATLVSNNLREFSRVSDLKVENWA